MNGLIFVGAGVLIGAGINKIYHSLKGEKNPQTYGVEWIGLGIALVGVGLS